MFARLAVSVAAAAMIAAMGMSAAPAPATGTATAAVTPMKKPGSVWKSLTDAQRAAIKSAMQSARKSALDNLVKAGTITQDEANQLAAPWVKGEKPPRPNLTDAQKQAVMSAMQSACKTALNGLVASGTITQEQADQLNAPRHGGHGKRQGEAETSSAATSQQ